MERINKIFIYNIMVSSYILMVLLIICFTINPFIKKHASSNVTSYEYTFIYQIFIVVFIVLYSIYLIQTKACDLTCYKKMKVKDIVWTILAVITGMVGSTVLLYLVKMDDVSYLIPNVQGIVILLGAAIGYFIFNESFDTFKFIGILLIFFGIISINYGKLTSS
jgi:multidrug transporter EmrE-like cation transporter